MEGITIQNTAGNLVLCKNQHSLFAPVCHINPPVLAGNHTEAMAMISQSSIQVDYGQDQQVKYQHSTIQYPPAIQDSTQSRHNSELFGCCTYVNKQYPHNTSPDTSYEEKVDEYQ